MDACDTCLRWSECNGVDADNCPLCRAQIDTEKPAPVRLHMTTSAPYPAFTEEFLRYVNSQLDHDEMRRALIRRRRPL